MFTKQFFGKLTWPTIISIIAVHVGAIFFRGTNFELPLLILIGLATLYVTWRSLENGLYVAFAEIFVGGHGHLLDAELFGFNISIRMVIYGAVMLVWLIRFLRKESIPKFIAFRDVPWAVLLLAVGIGTLIGFLQNNPSNAFDDANGFFTIAYLLPLISIKWTQQRKRELLQVFAASVAWLVFFTLLLSYLFTHLDGKSLNSVYRFVRDSRLAEITLQTVADSEGNIVNSAGEIFFGPEGYWYRIFMQSQLFVMIGILVVASMLYMVWRGQRVPWQASTTFAFLVSAIPLSTSRSFALGLAAAGLLLIVFSVTHGKRPLQSTASRSIAAILLSLCGFGIAWLTVAIPIPPQPDISDAAFYSTSADSGRDLAVSSRWQLLGPMMESIYASPILGSGFGKEVTFISDDPRVRAINPNGEWTTYRFEWGYQDIWLKTGLLGLFAFSLYAYVMMRATVVTARKHGYKWIVFGLGAGLVMLFVASVFSPFMNHPIGLAFMLFVLPFYDWEQLKNTVNIEVGARSLARQAPEIRPAMRVEEEI